MNGRAMTVDQVADMADELPQAIMMEALHRGCECRSKRLRVTGGVGFSMVGLEVDPIK